jgi:ketosteroid isomerase-like protein
LKRSTGYNELVRQIAGGSMKPELDPSKLSLEPLPSFAQDFAQFLKTREQASGAYIRGNVAPLAAITSRTDPASFMPPSGVVVTGAEAVTKAHAEGAKHFREGSRGWFEIIQAASAGDLGFWTGLHHAEMFIQGQDRPVPMVLRTTEIFRQENGTWKLVHRHADFLKQNA